ncbi:MAG: hypothetical protein WCH04_13875 [Gammaproteobacteria bacterium]
MKKSGIVGALFASILVIIALSANALEGITDNSDQYVLQNSKHYPITTQAQRTDGNSRRVTAPGILDIVFVVSNALLGFLLLRKVNNS